MVILNALSSVLSIVAMITIGGILTHKGWFDEKSSNIFSKMVCNIALPCLMISNLTSNFDKEKLTHLGKGLIIPFASMGICYLMGIIVSKIIKVKKGHIGTFRSMFFVSNAIFIGLPINMALFGDSSVPYVLLYYIGNTTFFWTIGVYGINKDGKNGSDKLFSKHFLMKIFSPPLMGFVVGIVLILLNIQIPKFILDTCKYFGNLTTPLSMIFIGITIYSVDRKKLRVSHDMTAILFGRFLVSPLLVLIASYFIPVPLLMKKVFVIQAAMPVMTNTAIVAKNADADYEYSIIMTVVTTICSLIFIPIYMWLLG